MLLYDVVCTHITIAAAVLCNLVARFQTSPPTSSPFPAIVSCVRTTLQTSFGVRAWIPALSAINVMLEARKDVEV